MTRSSLALSYSDFLTVKLQEGADHGFEPIEIPNQAFDFQQSLIGWSLRKGRAAINADCGLGKSLIELVWADNVRRHTGRPVLLLTPLAVARQMTEEGMKFDIECERASNGKVSNWITVTNYEQLHKFSPSDFSGVVCDESSILKSFDGARKTEITEFMRKIPYRLLATATAAPNDYVELGTSSEALGYLGHMDMLARFFKNDQNNCTSRRMYGEATQWRLKGHAETPFWQWVCSWARACRKPSDIGFDDGRFILPPLNQTEHMIEFHEPRDGMLFNLPAVNLREQREERRRTIKERCEKVAALVDHDRPAVVWCNLNDEGDLLESMIPDAVQVSGKDRDEVKEERFSEFSAGHARVLITKPKIGAWGLNWQHCSNVTYFPSHSFEQFYQAVRRCWRFGQTRPVQVDLVMTDGELAVMANLRRKADQASEMFDRLISEMNRAMHIEQDRSFATDLEVPSWL